MDQTFSPIVINSKAAQKDLNSIKAQHTDIVQGIQDQALKVANYTIEQNAKKEIETQQKQTSEIDNQKSMADAEVKRMDAENKRRELDIKQQALSL